MRLSQANNVSRSPCTLVLAACTQQKVFVVGVGPAGWMGASPEVLEPMEGAPYIHERLTRYTIIPDGGKLMVVMVEQLILQQYCNAIDDIIILLLYE